MFIKIEQNPDGSHAFQVGGVLETGWAAIPYDMELPSTFPFVNITVAEVTHPALTDTRCREADGQTVEETVVIRPAYTQLEVVSITEGEEIPQEEPAIPTTEERLSALEEAMLEMLGVHVND